MTLSLSVPPDQLTKSEQRILDFINTNAETFLFLSIGQLAEKLGVSDATISRFARHAGFRDFKALKSAVLEQSSGPAAKIAGTLHHESGATSSAWFESQIKNLRTTLERIDPAAFAQAIELICESRRVFVYGKNASASLAQMLHFRLRRLGINVLVLPSGGSEMLEGLNQAKEGDTVMFFAFSKISTECAIILEQARRVGYSTIAFTSRTIVPTEEQADVTLFACRGEEKEFHSMTAPVALIDALTVAATRELGDEGAESLKSLYQLKKEFFPEK